MLDLVRNESDLTIERLKQLHKMVLLESGDGGILRSGLETAMISGVKALFTPPWAVANLVREFLRWLSQSTRTENVHPFLLAESCHSVFVRIHPFHDGNGRMTRLLMNYVLLRAGYPPLTVLNSKKKQYIGAIKEWQKGDPGPGSWPGNVAGASGFSPWTSPSVRARIPG
jgi:Fic family protein